jgi:hypothetical protein
MNINLGRGQANAFGLVHGLQHIGNQSANAFINDGNRLGDGLQSCIREEKKGK